MADHYLNRGGRPSRDNHQFLAVPGNVTTWSEANVAQDPAATDFLFPHMTEMPSTDISTELGALKNLQVWLSVIMVHVM